MCDCPTGLISYIFTDCARYPWNVRIWLQIFEYILPTYSYILLCKQFLRGTSQKISRMGTRFARPTGQWMTVYQYIESTTAACAYFSWHPPQNFVYSSIWTCLIIPRSWKDRPRFMPVFTINLTSLAPPKLSAWVGEASQNPQQHIFWGALFHCLASECSRVFSLPNSLLCQIQNE